MRIFCLSLLLLLCLHGSARPYARYSPSLEKAFTAIIELRFDESQRLIEEASRVEPDNRCADYLRAALISVNIFISDDKARFKSAEAEFDHLIERLEELPREEALRDVFLGEIYLARAILNGKYKNHFTAAWQFYQGYRSLTENRRNFPGLIINKIPLGVLYAAIGSLPDDYRSMASLLGFEGDVQQGLRMLNQAQQQLAEDSDWSFYRPYAGFIYSFVHQQLATNVEPVSPASLGLAVSRSSFLIYQQAQVLIEQGRVREALQLLATRPRGEQYADFHYLDYLQAKAALGIDNQMAEQLFRQYLKQAGNASYRKSTNRYLSWIYLLANDRQAAEQMRQRVLSEGSDHTGADRQALLEAGQNLNPSLIKARVLFDAARYTEALNVLEQNSVKDCCPSPNERAEYYYRKGRVLQQLKRSSEALRQFQLALAVPQAEDSYALGNSALQLAIAATAAGDKSLARQYFKQSLTYDGFPFYEGIHQKAKAGLASLRN